jgi:hypothetical protein
MAKEIKSINVAPQAEETTINFWQIWGWELKSTQEIKTQDVQTYTGQSSDGSTRYYETKPGEHYVKLTFEREKSMPNYAELCELEQKYDSIYFPEEPKEPGEPYKPYEKKPEGCTWGCSITPIAIGALLCLIGSCDSTNGYIPLSLGGILCTIGISILVISMMLNKKDYSKEMAEWVKNHADWEKEHAKWEIKHNDWQKDCNEVLRMRREIIERAKSLLE